MALGLGKKKTKPVKVDLGIFAHNEEKTIGMVIADLARQSIFEPTEIDLKIYVIANGCSDMTVPRSTEARAALPSHFQDRIEIVDRELAGKSRTVHHFIHERARASADLLFFMDADIQIPQADTLARMAEQMCSRSELHAFTSRPVKDVVHFNLDVGAVARVIATAGGGLTNFRKSICGQLFVMRGPTARLIGLPAGLPVEDGFIRAMILTDLLSGPEALERIDGDPSIFHIYESIRGIRELVQHQTRIVIGSAINAALFAKIRRDAPAREAAHKLLMAAAKDDGWLVDTLRKELPKRPYGYVPFGLLTKRVRANKKSDNNGGAKRWLILGIGLGFDTFVYIVSSWRMIWRSGAGYW